MSTKKFIKATAKYKKTKRWKYIEYMFQQSSSFDDYKETAQYIIDSGVRNPNIRTYIKAACIYKHKFILLAHTLVYFRRFAETEDQIIEWCKLSLANEFWNIGWDIGMGSKFNIYIDKEAIIKLSKVATTHEAFCILSEYSDQKEFFLKKANEVRSNG